MLLPAVSLLSATALSGQAATPQDGVITVDGQTFHTWSEYVHSPSFKANNRRCNSPERDPFFVAPPSDCSASSTNPTAEYDVTDIRRVPVVVHVITNSSGTQGNISDGMVQSQIDILNEDFRAIASTNGENGFDTGIEFYLATEDPSGQPTNGITRSANTTWFNDGGSYWNALNWDPDRYVNIYTNQASGALGYVPFLPQTGNVGSSSDRVVVLWSSFGLNAPIGPPYNKGRTTTHEVGHYLGLYHTFSGGCGGGNCNNSGDLICDTNSETGPNFSCPGNSTCGSPDPIDNYMNYSDDLCMEVFTEMQSRRMRCTMDFFRPEVWSVDDRGDDVSNYCVGASNSWAFSGAYMAFEGSTSVGAQDMTLRALDVPAGTFGLFFFGPNQTQVSFGNGFRCVGGQTQRIQPIAQANGFGVVERTVNWAASYGQAFEALGLAGLDTNVQFWFRDVPGGGAEFNLSDGLNIPMRP